MFQVTEFDKSAEVARGSGLTRWQRDHLGIVLLGQHRFYKRVDSTWEFDPEIFHRFMDDQSPLDPSTFYRGTVLINLESTIDDGVLEGSRDEEVFEIIELCREYFCDCVRYAWYGPQMPNLDDDGWDDAIGQHENRKRLWRLFDVLCPPLDQRRETLIEFEARAQYTVDLARSLVFACNQEIIPFCYPEHTPAEDRSELREILARLNVRNVMSWTPWDVPYREWGTH